MVGRKELVSTSNYSSEWNSLDIYQQLTWVQFCSFCASIFHVASPPLSPTILTPVFWRLEGVSPYPNQPQHFGDLKVLLLALRHLEQVPQNPS
jgi:hypothetical protein